MEKGKHLRMVMRQKIQGVGEDKMIHHLTIILYKILYHIYSTSDGLRIYDP